MPDTIPRRLRTSSKWYEIQTIDRLEFQQVDAAYIQRENRERSGTRVLYILVDRLDNPSARSKPTHSVRAVPQDLVPRLCANDQRDVRVGMEAGQLVRLRPDNERM